MMRYKQGYDGDMIRPRRRGYRMKCCDCGLVHIMNFYYEKKGKRIYIIFSPRRDKKATSKARRTKKYKFKISELAKRYA